MKTILLRVCAWLALATSASAVIMGVDAFDYLDGAVAGQTGGVSWDRNNAQFFTPTGVASNWDNVSNAPQVFLGRLVTNNSSAKREYNGQNEGNGAFNDGTFAKAVYYRATVTTGPVLPDFMVMSSYDFGNERIFFGKRFGAANFGVGNAVANTFNDSLIPVQPNTTYVLVARVDYAADTLRLYVNPDLTAAEPASASASVAWTNTEWSTAVRLSSGFSGSPVTWDDITVATSWSDLALVVKSVADVDHGALGDTAQSLRDCLKYGAKGATILFAPALNGQTISLGSEIAVNSTSLIGDFIVDASALANGITINDGANDSYRLLNVNSGARLEVRGVTFANAGASTGSIDGGAVRNSGTLTLTRCTLTGNSAGVGNGGAVYSSGTLIVNQCTLAGNSAAFGGALTSVGDTRLVHTTVANNTAPFGGGIYTSSSTTSLLHCTVAGNSAVNLGGGIASTGDGSTHTVVKHSIVSGNAGSDVDFVGGAANSFTSQGRNLIGTGNATGAFNQTGDLINNLDPLLESLGSYGGRTQTMPPLAGSAAIDAAAAITGLDADQRGFARNRDGNNDATSVPDIGAAEAVFRFVTNTNDSGAGSLRQALSDAVATPGWEAIAFSSALNGGVISLTTTDPLNASLALIITDADGVAIDATSLSAGLTITKPAGNYGLFQVNSGKRLSLHQLTLTGGHTPFFGGAIRNAGGTLSLSDCTLTGNTASDGGAIFSISDLISTGKFTEIRRCTITGNTATDGKGGGIRNQLGKTAVLFSTISGNSAPTGGGIASVGNTSTFTFVTSSIISGNSGGDVVFTDDVTNSFTSQGRNLIGTGNATGAFNLTGDINNNIDPLLQPLGSYGGPTQTMPPRPGSPALDRAVALAGFGTDQRGFPRNRDGDANGTAAPDSGAVEASILAVTNANDSGAGSLRRALADAAALPGPDTLIFSQSLNGGTISLTTSASGSALTVNDAAGVTIDASTLTNGLTITKPAGSYRLFSVAAGSALSLDSLALTGGASGDGAALFNLGTATLTRCTLSGNAGVKGGSLFNDTGATMSVANSTLTGNAASGEGGAIYNSGSLTVRHATLSDNKTNSNAGGIANDGTLLLGNSIVAGNYYLVPTGRNDLGGSGTFTTQGGNLIGTNGFFLTGIFPAGLPNVNGDFAGTDGNPLDPRLLPLGKYNGPTQTMPPLAGSRAIDAGINFGLYPTDQRGLDRNADGDNNGIARPDSGAVEAAFRFVTNNNDSGADSLRKAVADATTVPGWEAIAFASGLDGGTISLTTSMNTSGFGPSGIEVRDTGGVAIDASSLPAGLTITKPAGDYRLFYVATNARLSLHQLTLLGGTAAPSRRGGAIQNFFGTLSLSDCTLTGNVALDGGAISSQSDAFSTGKVTEIRRCTITGNTATGGAGGAILNLNGRLVVAFSTISGNSASTGGGIYGNGDGLTSTVVNSSIISGNTSGGDVVFVQAATNSFTSQGYNLIGTGNATGAFNQSGDIINNTAPLLAPLDNYGGATKTMALMPGSPARNAGSGAAFDQRGIAVFGTPDIGAYETGTLAPNYNAFIWERLPATATAPQHASTFDFDGDGVSNGNEWLALTDPGDPVNYVRITQFSRSGNDVSYTFPSIAGRTYTEEYSFDLVTWTNIGTNIPGTGSPITRRVGPVTGLTNFFLRLRVGP